VTERPAPGLGIPVTPRCRGVSARQEEVLLLIGDGFGLGEIATRLGVSEWTVRTHRDEGRGDHRPAAGSVPVTNARPVASADPIVRALAAAIREIAERRSTAAGQHSANVEPLEPRRGGRAA
jgi:hypothetical protein